MNAVFNSPRFCWFLNGGLPTLLIWIVCSCSILSVHAHPASSRGLCHGPLVGVQYQYDYATEQILNNDNNLDPAGFAAQGSISVENLWQNKDVFLARVTVNWFQFKPRSNAPYGYKFTASPSIETWHPVLASVDGTSGRVKALYVNRDEVRASKQDSEHHHIEPTLLNLVVSVLNNLKTKYSDNEVSYC